LTTVFFPDDEYPIGCTKEEFYTIKEKSVFVDNETEKTVEFRLNIYHIQDLQIE